MRKETYIGIIGFDGIIMGVGKTHNEEYPRSSR